jgi:hypothetical protein
MFAESNNIPERYMFVDLNNIPEGHTVVGDMTGVLFKKIIEGKVQVPGGILNDYLIRVPITQFPTGYFKYTMLNGNTNFVQFRNLADGFIDLPLYKLVEVDFTTNSNVPCHLLNGGQITMKTSSGIILHRDFNMNVIGTLEFPYYELDNNVMLQQFRDNVEIKDALYLVPDAEMPDIRAVENLPYNANLAGSDASSVPPKDYSLIIVGVIVGTCVIIYGFYKLIEYLRDRKDNRNEESNDAINNEGEKDEILNNFIFKKESIELNPPSSDYIG